MIRDQTYFDSEKFNKAVSALSRKANLSKNFTLRPFMGGRNNRVFSVTYDNEKKMLLKAYFQHPRDPRDRIKSEYSFLKFAWENDIQCVPRPYAADFQNNLALYGYIEGRRLSPKEINKEKIEVALNFFIGVNKCRQFEETKNLPTASEACFSIKEHINSVEKRVNKLKKIKGDSEVDNKALSFIQNNLSRTWQKVRAYADDSIKKDGLSLDKEIVDEDKCISASDFGFHNALLDDSGRLYFIDFEYAGIDDPAKTVCDFFCQPEVPAPFKYFNFFAGAIANTTSDPERWRSRINALLPIYQIKWCSIMLNDFLDVGSERRNFAYGNIDFGKQKADQLEKARKQLDSIKFKKEN